MDQYLSYDYFFPFFLVHSWSEADGQWKKVGDVVGEPKSKDPSGKGKDGGRVTYEGVEYDHVFSIDIGKENAVEI